MSKHQLLVVEDDPALRALIKAFLEKEGYSVTGASSALEAQRLFSRSRFDLVMLDPVLPDEDGMVLARKLRTRGDIPIVFVSQRCDRASKLEALRMGGDDYLTKPFDPLELSIRIRNILRRSGAKKSSTAAHTVIGFDDFVIDLARRSLIKAGTEEINLTRAEFDLLAALVHARNRVLRRAVLLDAVCQGHEDTNERLVDVLVSRLRKKLGPRGKLRQVIKTVVGIGYQLGVPVEMSS